MTSVVQTYRDTHLTSLLNTADTIKITYMTSIVQCLPILILVSDSGPTLTAMSLSPPQRIVGLAQERISLTQ